MLSFVAHALATRNRRRAWSCVGVGLAIQSVAMLAGAYAKMTGGGLFDAFIYALIATVATTAFLAALSFPLLVAVLHYSDRKDLASGDDLLGAAAVWFFVVQAVQSALFFRDAFAPYAVAMTLALVALGTAIVRGVMRRAWCRRVERGEVAGLRVRPCAESDIDPEIPAIDDLAHGDFGIVERVDAGGSPYRHTSVGVAVVTLQAPIEVGS